MREEDKGETGSGIDKTLVHQCFPDEKKLPAAAATGSRYQWLGK
jgi:hypothetical protein